jgi:ribosomal protein S18 acetylase RimI-like enzyme
MNALYLINRAFIQLIIILPFFAANIIAMEEKNPFLQAMMNPKNKPPVNNCIFYIEVLEKDPKKTERGIREILFYLIKKMKTKNIFEEYNEEFSNYLNIWREGKSDKRLYLSFNEFGPIGFITTTTNGKTLTINNIEVKKDYRNKGLGTELVKLAVTNYFNSHPNGQVNGFATKESLAFYKKLLGIKNIEDYFQLKGKDIKGDLLYQLKIPFTKEIYNILQKKL